MMTASPTISHAPTPKPTHEEVFFAGLVAIDAEGCVVWLYHNYAVETWDFLPKSEGYDIVLQADSDSHHNKHDYVAPQRSSMQNLSETFGKPFSLLWFLPTAVKFHGLTYRDREDWAALDKLRASQA